MIELCWQAVATRLDYGRVCGLLQEPLELNSVSSKYLGIQWVRKIITVDYGGFMRVCNTNMRRSTAERV